MWIPQNTPYALPKSPCFQLWIPSIGLGRCPPCKESSLDLRIELVHLYLSRVYRTQHGAFSQPFLSFCDCINNWTDSICISAQTFSSSSPFLLNRSISVNSLVLHDTRDLHFHTCLSSIITFLGWVMQAISPLAENYSFLCTLANLWFLQIQPFVSSSTGTTKMASQLSLYLETPMLTLLLLLLFSYLMFSTT